MGVIFSICKRRPKIETIDGDPLNLYEEYESFTLEEDPLLCAEEGRLVWDDAGDGKMKKNKR